MYKRQNQIGPAAYTYIIILWILQEVEILLRGCLTCEELVGHQIELLGRNETNYFMYWRGLCPPNPLTHQALKAHTSQPILYRRDSVNRPK